MKRARAVNYMTQDGWTAPLQQLEVVAQQAYMLGLVDRTEMLEVEARTEVGLR